MAPRQSLKVEAPATFSPPTRHVKILHEWRQAQETQQWAGNKYPECSTVTCSHSCVKMSGSPPGGREVWVNLSKSYYISQGPWVTYLNFLLSEWRGTVKKKKMHKWTLSNLFNDAKGDWMTSKPCTPEEERAELVGGRGCRILFVSCHLWDTDLHRGSMENIRCWGQPSRTTTMNLLHPSLLIC